MAAKPSSKSVKAVAAKRATGAALTTPSQSPNIGAKLSTNRPTHTGAKLSGLKTAKPPTRAPAAAPTRTAPAAPAAPTAPPPFLTPAEQAAWNKYQGGYADRIGNINPDSLAGASPDQITQALINGGGTLGQSLSQGQSRYTAGMGNAQQSHDLSADNANQVMAARGLFQSSIRDADLNDIDATLAARQATLNTAWGSLQTRIGTAYNQAVRDFGTTGGYYNGLSVSNAQASDTGMPGPSTGTSTTSGTAAAGSASTAPVNTTVGPTKPIAQPGPAWNAGASTSFKPPKPQAAPKPPGAGIPTVSGGFGYRGGF